VLHLLIGDLSFLEAGSYKIHLVADDYDFLVVEMELFLLEVVDPVGELFKGYFRVEIHSSSVRSYMSTMIWHSLRW
jgi:hypothetical protein